MAFTYVSTTANQSTFTSSTTPTCAYASTGPSANSLLICAVFIDDSTTTPADNVDKITDTKGNVWVRSGTAFLNSTQFLSAELWYCEANKTAGANTLTLTLSAASTVGGSIFVSEYTTSAGAGGKLNAYGGATKTTASATTLAIPTTGSANSGDLVVAVAGLHNTSAITLANSSSYNTRQTRTGTLGPQCAYFDLLSAAAGVQTCTATFTSHQYEAGGIASFAEKTGAASSAGLSELTANEPAIVAGTSPLTTASFSVPANSLLVASVLQQADGGGTTPTITLSDSGSHTWSTLALEAPPTSGGPLTGNSGGATGIYCAFISSAATLTVSATLTSVAPSPFLSHMSVAVFSTASPTQNGVTGTFTNWTGTSSTTGDIAITTTKAGSFVLGTGLANDSWGLLTPDPTTELVSMIADATNDFAQAFWRSNEFVVTPGTATYGGKWSGNHNSSAVVAEIVPALPITESGPVSAIALAGPTPTFNTTIVGSTAALTLAAPTPTFSTKLSGPVANEALAAIAGTLNYAMVGLAKDTAITAPAGLLTTRSIAAPVATLTLGTSGIADTSIPGVATNVNIGSQPGVPAYSVLGPLSVLDMSSPDDAGTIPAPAQRFVLSKWDDPAERGFQLGVTPTGELEFTFSPDGVQVYTAVTFGANIQANQWQHIACTYDSGTVSFFVNGAFIGSVADLPANIFDTPANLIIGGRDPVVDELMPTNNVISP